MIGHNGSIVATFPAGPLVGTAANPVDPRLRSLGNYTGPTQTMPLLPGSPAIDAGQPTLLTRDQRGLPRVTDGDRNGTAEPDLGAFEVGVSTVTSTADNGPGSLRSMIEASSTGNEWLSFDAAVFNVNGGVTITLATQLSVVGKAVQFDTSNLPHGLTLSGNDVTRILSIDAASSVLLEGLTLTGGKTSLTEDGGAINNAGSLIVRRCTMMRNLTGNRGGAIFSTGPVSLVNVSLTENQADNLGGGIFALSGALNLESCTITENVGCCGEGGVKAGGGIILKNTLVAGNRAVSHNDIAGNAGNGSAGNLIGDGAGLTGLNNGVNGNQVGTASLPIPPQLAPLGHYGGSTRPGRRNL